MAVIDDAVGLYRASQYGGSGDWLDESGNGYDMVPAGSPTFVAAGNNSYFDLNGTNQWFATSGDVADFDFAAAESFTAVVVAAGDDDSGGGQPVLTKKTSLAQNNVGWVIYLNIGQIRCLISDGTTRTFNDPGPTMTTGVRQLWAVRRDVGDDKLYANVDATETEVIDATSLTLANALTTRIGAFDTDATNYNGRIYAAAIWRRALSDIELVSLEAELVPGKTRLLILGVP